ncbi:MAG: hypothetical protein AAB624_01870 [Patescibacteria group bacterium]
MTPKSHPANKAPQSHDRCSLLARVGLAAGLAVGLGIVASETASADHYTCEGDEASYQGHDTFGNIISLPCPGTTPTTDGGGGGGGNGVPEWAPPADCEVIPNRDDYAEQLADLINYDSRGNVIDGSPRLVRWVQDCDILPVGEYDEMIDRFWFNVELAIALPENDITPNPPQEAWLQDTIATLTAADREANPGLYPALPTTSTVAETTSTTEAPAPSSSIPPVDEPDKPADPTIEKDIVVFNLTHELPEKSNSLLYSLIGGVAAVTAIGGLLVAKSRRQQYAEQAEVRYLSPDGSRALAHSRSKISNITPATRSAFDHKIK